MKKWIFIIFLILLIGIPSLIRINKRIEKEDKKEDTIPVTVTLPQKGNVIQIMSFSSRIEGVDQTFVYSDIPGRFLRFTVEDGERVRDDQTIAYIELETPGVERKPISVKSPITGVISLSPLGRGQPVLQRIPIAQVAKISRVKVEFDVPERFHLKKGDRIEVEIPSLNKRFKGKIKKASAFYNSQSRTQRIQGIIPNSDQEIIPGMFARVWVIVAEEVNVITLPPEAVIGAIDRFVFKVENGRAVLVPVEIGISSDSLVAIRKGLTEEDTVLIEGQYIVKDQSMIDIKEIQ